jgi:hypothetical protein
MYSIYGKNIRGIGTLDKKSLFSIPVLVLVISRGDSRNKIVSLIVTNFGIYDDRIFLQNSLDPKTKKCGSTLGDYASFRNFSLKH